MNQEAMDVGLEQYEKKIYDQKQLINISKALNSNLDIHSLMSSILDISLTQSQAIQVGVYLNPAVDRNDFALVEDSIGFDIASADDYQISEKSPFIRFITERKSKGTLSLSELLEAQENGQDLGGIPDQLKTLNDYLLLVPMRAKGKISGIIVLGPKVSGDNYTSTEKAFLSDLASIAAIAVENARLYERATVDMMTKLKNKHYFQTTLHEEIDLLKEAGKPVTLMLTDIDKFKPFNDTYGHQLGDLVLIEVAKTLIAQARALDIPCRYGGEEFAMIFPNTELDKAYEIAEQTREAVMALEVDNPTDIGEKVLKVTISIGVAQFDLDKDTVNKDIIERADKALYKAKHGGRNQVQKAD